MEFDTLFARLKKHFPGMDFQYRRDPFRVLITTIISQRTRDEQTAIAARDLLSVYPTVEMLASADVADIERLIKPAGFYRVKAEKIKEVCQILLTDHKGQVPSDLETLLGLPSVGRKTANCVLVFGFNKPAIPVDTHVHRISNRLGLVTTRKPDHTEKALITTLPKEYWPAINHLFVTLGKTICRPITPRCYECPITDLCNHHSLKRK
jgi:endonuclease-3